MANLTFLGAGLLGSAFAEAALGRGDTVTVWNRSLDKAKPLADLGARLASSPAEAVADAERVHLVLAADPAVDDVLEALRPGLPPGAVVIDHSTTSPAATRARFERCLVAGIPFLHAPVFMSPQNAREARGIMLCSGPHARFAQVERDLALMTGDVWYLGPRPDLAAAYKLFGNAMLLAVVGGVADVLAMARGLDIPADEALAVFGRFKPTAAIEVRGARMARGDYSPSFALHMARKDVGLMLEAAGDLPLAVLAGLAARMDAVLAAGHGAADVGVIAAAHRKQD